ncbi:hypothetical protein FGO68_gene7125 [Halteria grandinella]|uniref:Uncharacterized protein n=1 Tax=Halteria grandinella TaxID=5974 RepID=A0A8J8STU5_HALGN|nr:hypothetical protein FGO68_gene7125 [Halteria grandinella]
MDHLLAILLSDQDNTYSMNTWFGGNSCTSLHDTLSPQIALQTDHGLQTLVLVYHTFSLIHILDALLLEDQPQLTELEYEHQTLPVDALID